MRVGCGIAGLLWATSAFGAAPASLEFNRDVRPILSDRCFSCHGPDSAARKSPLRLDQEESARAALAAGDPAHSQLYSADHLHRQRAPHAARLHGARAPARLRDRDAAPLDRTGREVSAALVADRARSGPALPAVKESRVAAQRDRRLRAGAPGSRRARGTRRRPTRRLCCAASRSISPGCRRPRRRRRRSSPTTPPAPTKRRWTGCWPRRGTPSAWRSAGWKRRDMPTPTAISPTARAICGAGAIG